MKKQQRMSALKRVLIVLLALTAAGILAFGSLLGCVLWGDRDQAEGQAGVMVILGCQVMPSGKPSVLLQDRLDKAMAYLEGHPDMIVVVSGGQGPNEPTTEAAAMADYLMANGVEEGRILQEGESHNTNQNLRYTMALLAREGYDVTDNIIVVSNEFHLTRVRMLWARICGGDDNLMTLAAPSSHRPTLLAMYIREPMALVKSFLFDRG